MSWAALTQGPAAPYLLLLIVGFLPSEIWRMLGVVLARGLDDGAPLLAFVRAVATALLAAVVAKLVLSPNGALAGVPLWGRAGGLAAGLAGFFALRRSLVAGVLIGQAVLLASAWWAGLAARG